MYQPNRILERELEFTKIYRENIGQPKAVRESRLLFRGGLYAGGRDAPVLENRKYKYKNPPAVPEKLGRIDGRGRLCT